MAGEISCAHVDVPDPCRWVAVAEVLFRGIVGGVVDSATPCRVVRDDSDCIALYLCPGTVFRARGGTCGGPSGRVLLPDGWDGSYERRVWHTHRVLIVYRPGDAHSVGVFWREREAAPAFWYINPEAPWRRTTRGFDTRDHTLDIVVSADLSSWEWKDEDEFAFKQAVGMIPPDEAAATRAEGWRAIERIERGATPYRDGWELWTPDPVWVVPELPANWDEPPTPPPTATH
ncbi:MAG: DUF402 domain-containing protein [Chloroflexi bacterium]|nr:DUF402 domain-containing protein [Chloroflexota bacterium]